MSDFYSDVKFNKGKYSDLKEKKSILSLSNLKNCRNLDFYGCEKSNCERMKIMGKDLNGKQLGKGLSQRPDGRYMGRAQVNGHPIVLYDWKLKELKKRLAIAIDEVKRSSLMSGMDGKAISLNEWFEEWYSKYKAPILKNGGSASYKRKFANYYGVRIGSKALADIRQLHVQTAISDMLEAGRSSKSIRDATGVLQNCIEAAIANGLMTINPVLGVVIPKCETVERRVLTVEEQQIFLDYLARKKAGTRRCISLCYLLVYE